MERKYLYIKDMCERYDVKRWTIWSWCKRGKIPKPDKSLGRPRWWRPAIDEFDRGRREAVR